MNLSQFHIHWLCRKVTTVKILIGFMVLDQVVSTQLNENLVKNQSLDGRIITSAVIKGSA